MARSVVAAAAFGKKVDGVGLPYQVGSIADL
jgi:hypothetical protein